MTDEDTRQCSMRGQTVTGEASRQDDVDAAEQEIRHPRAGWLPFRRVRPDIGFGAFISYSGRQDRELISRLQRGIEKLATKWYLPPVAKVFVDKTSIAAGTRLWSRIEDGLSRSAWLILVASPEAAQSWWVNREVDWWVTHRPLDNLIIVHTAGVLRWDRDLQDFSADSTAIPPPLRGSFDEEPVWASVPQRLTSRLGRRRIEHHVHSAANPCPRVVVTGLP
jgi:hypothetical protein